MDHNLIIVGSRRERKAEATRRRLYDSAIRLFQQQGYESTTVQDICNVADTAKQTFFNYFPSKEHILAAYHDELVRKILAELSELHSASPRKMVLSAMSIFAAAAEKSVSISRTILRHVFASDVLKATDQKNEAQIHSWFRSQFRDAVLRGEMLPGMNVALLTAVVMAILSSTVQEWIVSEESFDLEESLVRRVRFLLDLGRKKR
ncbi:TetR/AcrR family transcriptional regulator [bacterium]|nr:TetR/AcrR family transcriptional regulator [bacterium]MCI0601422.1 TetR/AcrR family transcriptional regulator [bacterium]